MDARDFGDTQADFRLMIHRVITANRLHDGAVIWLGPDAKWVEQVDGAEPCADDEAVEARLAAARELESAGRIIDAYAVEVVIEEVDHGTRLVPVRLREKIRANGPTVAFA